MVKTLTDRLRLETLRVSRLHFYLVGIYLITTVAFDSWNLITHDAVIQRWGLGVALLVATTLLWFVCRLRFKETSVPYQTIMFLFIVVDLAFASFNVYDERGMASKSVALFFIPLLVAAFYRSRTALLTAATLCSAAYALTTVSYFYKNYGEGFKVELYGGIFFFSAMFFIAAWLLNILVRREN